MKNQVIQGQTRKIIYNVYRYFEREAAIDRTSNTKSIQNRTTLATKISNGTLRRILKEARENNEQFKTPEKSRKKSKYITGVLDDHAIEVIERCIKEVQLSGTVTVNKIFQQVHNEITFPGSARSFRRILTVLGYEFQGAGPRRTLVKKNVEAKADEDEQEPMSSSVHMPMPMKMEASSDDSSSSAENDDDDSNASTALFSIVKIEEEVMS